MCVFQVKVWYLNDEKARPGSDFDEAKQVESFIQQRSRDTEGLRPAVLLGAQRPSPRTTQKSMEKK